MILTILNFIWIFICTVAVGMLIVTLMSKFMGKTFYEDIAVLMWMGILGLTIYSEVFSLFYRVGLMANAILGLCVAGIVIVMRKEIPCYVSPIVSRLKEQKELIIVTGLIIIYFAVAATRIPNFCDTDLYHAPAIQWIERYGVVPGLGNLHNRFAYNSAFLCLQALFSWRSVIGQSLHGMNAFLGMMMTFYAIMTLSPLQKKKMQVADGMNLLIVYYIAGMLGDISSPNTDFSAMLIVLFIFSKWLRGGGWNPETENKEEELLSLLILFGITIKLSVIPLALYLIKPLVRYIRGKKWKDMGVCFIMACIVALPFVLRNVIISGYLLYPYAWLDIFHVDWKMPAYMVIRDNHEIMAWGRLLKDVEKYGLPFKEWFPIWFHGIEREYSILAVINFVLSGIMAFRVIILIKHRQLRENIEKIFMIATAMICLLTWLFTAPLIRYGQVYLYLLPVIFLSELLLHINKKWIINVVCIMLVYVLAGRFYMYVADWNGKELVFMPEDYREYPVTGMDFEGIIVYVPRGVDETGYKYFPSTPYVGLLDVIEMRSGDLKDGFRMKEEYRNANVTNTGSLDNISKVE